jgi:four helix bundle protein
MAFQVEELSIQLIEALVPLMPRIRQRDKSLEDQLRRAASSIGLNCAEAAFSDPGNRRARLFTAAGSAGETRHALRQAIAWRSVTAGDAERAMRLAERIVAILWRMTRGQLCESCERYSCRDRPLGAVTPSSALAARHARHTCLLETVGRAAVLADSALDKVDVLGQVSFRHVSVVRSVALHDARR